MTLMYKVKHYTNKVLYTFFGPADLDDHNDPVLRMNREYAEKLGKLPAAPDNQTNGALESASKVKAIA